MTGAVRIERAGALGRVTVDRPPLNVLTTPMLGALAQAFLSLTADASVRLIRLDARGKAFSAGVDVADHVGERIGPMLEALQRLFDVLDALDVPTVAVVQGPALGGGCELALATDLCLASERATFGQPEIRLGLFAPPASVLLPRLVGERRALWMLLSGAPLAADEAERIGLVNAVLPHDALEEQVQACLAPLLALSGAALRHAKRAVRMARGLGAAEARRRVARLYREELMATRDAREGLQAFQEKRPPEWSDA